MKKYFLLALMPCILIAQENKQTPKEPGHYDNNKFSQMYDLLATPNMFRTASGAPGPAYYQQKADYKMDIILDDKNKRIDGVETITYHNNSPETLEYVWVQLDQNEKKRDSKSPLVQSQRMDGAMPVDGFVKKYMQESFDGGFNLIYVNDANGKPLNYVINQTMMRIDLPTPLKPKEKVSFSTKWWYNINDRMAVGGRSGYEYFEQDDNYLYTVAQFFPRMCVYNDVEGWQNKQFLGRGEFTLPFGVGVRMVLTDRVDVGVEFGYRKTFTDYMDDVSRSYIDQNALLLARGPKAVEMAFRTPELPTHSNDPYPVDLEKRGSPQYKDNYYFLGVTLTYRLTGGDRSGAGSGNRFGGKRRSSLGCPTNVF